MASGKPINQLAREVFVQNDYNHQKAHEHIHNQMVEIQKMYGGTSNDVPPTEPNYWELQHTLSALHHMAKNGELPSKPIIETKEEELKEEEPKEEEEELSTKELAKLAKKKVH